jgi:hypothetical protein
MEAKRLCFKFFGDNSGENSMFKVHKSTPINLIYLFFSKNKSKRGQHNVKKFHSWRKEQLQN